MFGRTDHGVQAICSDAVTVKSSPATSERPRALNSSLRAVSSASAPFTMASARPIASARAQQICVPGSRALSGEPSAPDFVMPPQSHERRNGLASLVATIEIT